MRKAWLVLRALCELALYDANVRMRGAGFALRQLRGQSAAGKPVETESEQEICEAVLLATCFYWKPVMCLQRAACTVLMLRKQGVSARLMIGYRPAPFFSHAWVEVDGRVAYGSAAYQQRLQVLHAV